MLCEQKKKKRSFIPLGKPKGKARRNRKNHGLEKKKPLHSRRVVFRDHRRKGELVARSQGDRKEKPNDLKREEAVMASNYRRGSEALGKRSVLEGAGSDRRRHARKQKERRKQSRAGTGKKRSRATGGGEARLERNQKADVDDSGRRTEKNEKRKIEVKEREKKSYNIEKKSSARPKFEKITELKKKKRKRIYQEL